MKKRNRRVLTEKDMVGSEHKLSSVSEFDKLVNVCRVVCELYDQGNPKNLRISDVLCSDKSLGKRPVSGHQESNKEPVFSSRTCVISGFELVEGGVRGETSLSSRFYEIGSVRKSLGDHDDQVVTEEVLGKKRKRFDSKYEDFEFPDQVVIEKVLGNKTKCFDSEDEEFEYGDQDVKEKVLGKERKCYDIKDEDSEYSEEEEKKPRNNNRARNKVVETAPLPVEFANEIQRLGGNDVRLLIQKYITNTDLNRKQNRLNLSINQLREEAKDFLTEAEKMFLEGRNKKGRIVSMQVPLLEPNLNRSHIKFKKWYMNSSFWYVLCGSWTTMHRNNHLEAGRDLQVWSFRVNGVLNLALVKVPPPINAAVVPNPDQVEDGNQD